ncbi:hypothetical protein L6164_022667 [Bauhinia variegata]|uniref:Uncharacterized protein n=1 Tax=Bauhinia variegata TaxID=167791 RepID=A0ACB9MH85_BAUVA|nr:hypothetical protein L6164_022667 [Bauhinia variegata]
MRSSSFLFGHAQTKLIPHAAEYECRQSDFNYFSNLPFFFFPVLEREREGGGRFPAASKALMYICKSINLEVGSKLSDSCYISEVRSHELKNIKANRLLEN